MTQENEKRYIVRLLIQVDAGNPQDAVKAFAERIGWFGVYAWTFGVVDKSTGEAFHVTRNEVERVGVEELRSEVA